MKICPKRLQPSVISFKTAMALVSSEPATSLFVKVVSEFYPEDDSCRFALEQNRRHVVVNIDEFERVDDWRLKPMDQLRTQLASIGLTAGRRYRLFVYDSINVKRCQTGSRFDASARVYTMLECLGFSAVSIVHDASLTEARILAYLKTLENSGHRFHSIVETQKANEQADFLLSHSRMTQVVTANNNGCFILDARTPEEFHGLVTGYSYIPSAGRIRKAINIPSSDYQASDAESLTSLLIRLQQRLNALKIAQHDSIIWYCGTSWRASRMYALSRELGYTAACIYEGGWFEWQSETVIQQGEQRVIS